LRIMAFSFYAVGVPVPTGLSRRNSREMHSCTLPNGVYRVEGNLPFGLRRIKEIALITIDNDSH
jgi:hypothetical protein